MRISSRCETGELLEKVTFKLTPKGVEIAGERGQDEGRKLRAKPGAGAGPLER